MVSSAIDPSVYQGALRRRLDTINQMGADATSNFSALMAARRAADAAQEQQGFNNNRQALLGQQAQGYSSPGTSYQGSGKDTFENFMGAIRQRESSGRYGVMGVPVHGDRALGAYQIMGNNLPGWSKQVLGHSVTPQQFLHSKQLQDQIAGHFLQNYYNKYGPAGAAVAWYAGEGTARKWVKNHGQGFNNPQYASGHQFSSISSYAYGILKSMGLV